MQDGFQWDTANLEHIARHRVTSEEAEQVLVEQPFLYDARAPEVINGEERWKVHGMTNQGRLLTIAFVMISETSFRIVTAYDMSAVDRKNYWSEL